MSTQRQPSARILEIKEWWELKRELFKGQSFVVPDKTNPKWQRYDELTGKLIACNAIEQIITRHNI